MTHGHLSRAERGQSQLSIESLYRLARVLDMRRVRNVLAPFMVEDEQAS